MNPLKLQWEDVAAIFSTSPLFIPDPGGSHMQFNSIQLEWHMAHMDYSSGGTSFQEPIVLIQLWGFQ